MNPSYKHIGCEALTKDEHDRLVKLLDETAVENTPGYGRVWAQYNLARDSFGTVYVSLERDGTMFYCHTL